MKLISNLKIDTVIIYIYKNRTIVTPTNDIVNVINQEIMNLVSEEKKIYYSSDSICKATGGCDELKVLYPIEFLNSLNFNGFPQHELHLKKIYLLCYFVILIQALDCVMEHD